MTTDVSHSYMCRRHCPSRATCLVLVTMLLTPVAEAFSERACLCLFLCRRSLCRRSLCRRSQCPLRSQWSLVCRHVSSQAQVSSAGSVGSVLFATSHLPPWRSPSPLSHRWAWTWTPPLALKLLAPLAFLVDAPQRESTQALPFGLPSHGAAFHTSAVLGRQAEVSHAICRCLLRDSKT